jgi:hypothetical protein
MILVSEMKPMVLYKKPFHLPIVEKDRKKGNASFILTKDFSSSMLFLKNPLLINRNYYESYYIERDISVYLNENGFEEDSNFYHHLLERRGEITDVTHLSRVYKMRFKHPIYAHNKLADDERNNVGGAIKDTKAAGSEDIEGGHGNVPNPVTAGSNNVPSAAVPQGATTGSGASAQTPPDDDNEEEKDVKESASLGNMTGPMDVYAYMKRYITIDDSKKVNSKLQTPDYTLDKGKGNFVDQAWLTRYLFSKCRSKIVPIIPSWILFLCVSDRKSNKYDTLFHAVAYCVYRGKFYWCENVWSGNVGLHSYDDYEDMIQDIRKRYKNDNMSSDMPYLSIHRAYINQFEEGMNNEDILNHCMESSVPMVYNIDKNSEYVLNEAYIDISVPDGGHMRTYLNEANKQTPIYRKLMYKERMRKLTELTALYEQAKEINPFITKTFVNYAKYKKRNLFIDLFYYNNLYFRNSMYKLDRGISLYLEFLNRLINDGRIEAAGYTKKTVFVPIEAWIEEGKSVIDYRSGVNPISIVHRLIKTDVNALKIFKGIDFIFVSANRYFKINFDTIERQDAIRFATLIEKCIKGMPAEDSDTGESPKAIVANIAALVSGTTGVDIVDIEDKRDETQKYKLGVPKALTGDENRKDALMSIARTVADGSTDTEAALSKMDDTYTKAIVMDLLASEESKNKISNARIKRMSALNDKFLSSKIEGVPISALLNDPRGGASRPITPYGMGPIDTVTEEWKTISYPNYDKEQYIPGDILRIMYAFGTMTVPVGVIGWDEADTSTTEDYKKTYTFKMEGSNGTRFTIRYDVPTFKDGRYMHLRGNDKYMSGQLLLLPITKTDVDTVQIVSNYNKIFVTRSTDKPGSSNKYADIIIKALAKNKNSNIKVYYGDNTGIGKKYDLPLDYVDLSSVISKIEMKDRTLYFNQDELRKAVEVKEAQGHLAYGIMKTDGSVIQNQQDNIGYHILSDLVDGGLDTTGIRAANKHVYSRAKIMGTVLPLIVVVGYNEGLIKVLGKAKIRYDFLEKKPTKIGAGEDLIQFKDGYLHLIDCDQSTSLLMNGLKDCNTEDYGFSEVNNKMMWIDFLEIFGRRLIADGLDNFYDLMIDPITKEVLEDLDLPTDYVTVLLYANGLLAYNGYFKHISMEARRYRTNEIISGYVYKAMAESYGRYRTDLKNTDKASMSMKQSRVIDMIMDDNTSSDLSDINPINVTEARNEVTFKGLSGMNSDRSYGLDKRTYDESMVGILSMSTGFATNVGITRQATVDMSITGARGYLKPLKDKKKMNTVNNFSVTETLTPYGPTHDDPIRSAMGFIQTSKHLMRVKGSDPMLVTTGGDQALPYLTSSSYAFKAKGDGKVTELTDEYMVVKYGESWYDYIDLTETVRKNSNGGTYIVLKLDTDLKLGSSFKKDQILAMDKESFSTDIGKGEATFTPGPIGRVAVMNTDEGYEDSALVTKRLSKALTSDVAVQKAVVLPKSTNVYSIMTKGSPVQEGDHLIVFQNAFDEEDVNMLLKNLADDIDGEISELGRIPVKSKVSGTIQDIKLYRTVETSELSPSLKKIFDAYEKPILERKKKVSKLSNSQTVEFGSTDKVEPTGKFKDAEDGVLIEFYLKYEDEFGVGDKLIYYNALKGVLKDQIPEGKEPYPISDPERKIDALLSVESASARMVTSLYQVGSLTSCMIELDRKIKKMLKDYTL